MALNVFELFGKIAIDSSGAEKGINSTVDHAKNAESSLSKTFKKIGGMVAAAFSVRAVVDFGKQCTQAYASIAAEESAFAQIMGDYADTAQAKLDAVSDATGVTSTRLTTAMTSLTAKFKGLGYDVEDATTLATDGLLIASDAAAFWDMSLDESMSHLNSFINGSYEGGEAIGLFANDTQMAAYAVEQGIVKDAKAWAKLDEAQRQATRLDYAKKMQENSGATGQAAKESQQYANVMANLKEHWRQFQGIIGKPILEKLVLPAMQKLNNFMPKLNESVQNGIVWLEEGFGKIKGYFEEVFTEDGINFDALPDALTNMFRDLNRSVVGLLSSFGQKLKAGWSNTVWPMIQKTFKAVFGIELPSWDEVKANVVNGWNNVVWPAIKDFFTKPLDITLPSWDELKTNIVNGWNNTVWPAIQGFFTQAFGVTLPSWDELKNDIVDGWNNTVWPAIKDFFTQAFEIVLPVWETLKTNIVNGWNNIVVPALAGLFTAVFEVKPEDADGTEVGKKLREWWDKVVAVVGDIFGAIFSVVPEDANGEATGQKIIDWWKSVVSFVGNIFRGFFGIDPEDEESVGNRIITWWENVRITVGDIFGATFKLATSLFADDGVSWVDKIKTWWNSIFTSLGDMISANFNLQLPDAKEVIADIVKWWNGILSDISLSLSAFWNGITGGGSESSTSEGGSVSSDFVGPLLPGWTADDPATETQKQRRYGVPSISLDGTGGANSLPGLISVIQTLAGEVQSMTSTIPDAIASGIGAISITGNVSTGNVLLDGVAVGKQTAPYVNFQLGTLNRRGSR